ncbi:MAG: hypothetical protein ACI9LM_000517 [Alteromonadaceae bacterium]|jgi:uncharacterized protein (TIGR02285 family)
MKASNNYYNVFSVLKTRNKTINIFIVSAAILFFPLSGYTHTINKITWYTPDSPPGYILSGEYQNKGYNDLKLVFIIKSLPEYHHKKVAANYGRALLESRCD